MANEIENKKLLKVKSITNAGKLAGSIYSCFEEDTGREITLRAVGAGALNQAVKAVILANRQFVKGGKIARILPSFQSFDDDLTAVELTLKIMTI